jgi:hypothetical protein
MMYAVEPPGTAALQVEQWSQIMQVYRRRGRKRKGRGGASRRRRTYATCAAL